MRRASFTGTKFGGGGKRGRAKRKGLLQDRRAKLADVANNTIIKIEAGKN